MRDQRGIKGSQIFPKKIIETMFTDIYTDFNNDEICGRKSREICRPIQPYKTEKFVYVSILMTTIMEVSLLWSWKKCFIFYLIDAWDNPNVCQKEIIDDLDNRFL